MRIPLDSSYWASLLQPQLTLEARLASQGPGQCPPQAPETLANSLLSSWRAPGRPGRFRGVRAAPLCPPPMPHCREGAWGTAASRSEMREGERSALGPSLLPAVMQMDGFNQGRPGAVEMQSGILTPSRGLHFSLQQPPLLPAAASPQTPPPPAPFLLSGLLSVRCPAFATESYFHLSICPSFLPLPPSTPVPTRRTPRGLPESGSPAWSIPPTLAAPQGCSSPGPCPI